MGEFLVSLSHFMEEGYMSYIAQEPTDEKVSIAWNQNTTCGLIVEEVATGSSIDTPFCFNMGTTSHILPFKSDFVKLRSIEPKDIHGVNGPSIPAIVVSIIKVRCSKGRRFTMNYTLYAPQVALCLISVGRLGEEKCQVTFEATHCQVLRNSKVLAKGIREGKHMYHLQCNTPLFEHAVIAHAIPTLETWHQ